MLSSEGNNGNAQQLKKQDTTSLCQWKVYKNYTQVNAEDDLKLRNYTVKCMKYAFETMDNIQTRECRIIVH